MLLHFARGTSVDEHRVTEVLTTDIPPSDERDPDFTLFTSADAMALGTPTASRTLPAETAFTVITSSDTLRAAAI
jgi:hypothetical protein